MSFLARYLQLGVNNPTLEAEPPTPTRPDCYDRPQTSYTYSHQTRPTYYYDDGQKSTLRSKRSMPSLRLPVSRFSVDSDSTHSSRSSINMERDRERYSPSLRSRRSVTSMKQLLPLKLHSTPPMPKITSWLDDTLSSDPPSPAPFDFGLNDVPKDLDKNQVPWMHSSQEEQLLSHLRPDRYRETPVYSEPNSPLLARAYFTNEDLCFACPPPGSTCQELCIVNSYESVSSESQDSYAACTDTFDPNDHEGSIETSPTSYTSSRISDFSALSIQCKGEYPDESVWLRNSIRESLEASLQEYRETEEPASEKWIESDSSRCSSPMSCNEVYDVRYCSRNSFE